MNDQGLQSFKNEKYCLFWCYMCLRSCCFCCLSFCTSLNYSKVRGSTCLSMGQGKGLLYLEFKLYGPDTSSSRVFLTVLQVFSIYSVRVSMKQKLPLQLSLGIIERGTVLKRQQVEAACFQKRNAQVQPAWLSNTSLNASEGRPVKEMEVDQLM